MQKKEPNYIYFSTERMGGISARKLEGLIHRILKIQLDNWKEKGFPTSIDRVGKEKNKVKVEIRYE